MTDDTVPAAPPQPPSVLGRPRRGMTIKPQLYRPQIDSLVGRLTARRRELGWPQTEVDEATGWSSGLTGHFERSHRRPSLAALIEWSHALGCEIVFATVRTPPRRMPDSALRRGLHLAKAPTGTGKQRRGGGRRSPAPVVQLIVAERLRPRRAVLQPAASTEKLDDEMPPHAQADREKPAPNQSQANRAARRLG